MPTYSLKPTTTNPNFHKLIAVLRQHEIERVVVPFGAGEDAEVYAGDMSLFQAGDTPLQNWRGQLMLHVPAMQLINRSELANYTVGLGAPPDPNKYLPCQLREIVNQSLRLKICDACLVVFHEILHEAFPDWLEERPDKSISGEISLYPFGASEPTPDGKLFTRKANEQLSIDISEEDVEYDDDDDEEYEEEEYYSDDTEEEEDDDEEEDEEVYEPAWDEEEED